MRQFIHNSLILSALFVTASMSACRDKTVDEIPDGASTYVGFSIEYNGQLTTDRVQTRYSEDDYNKVGTDEGKDLISTIDLYLVSPDGAFLESKRFVAATDLTYSYNSAGIQVIEPRTPFKTTAGDKVAIVIINSPRPLMATQPADDQTFAISTSLPFSAIGSFVDYQGERRLQSVFTGKSAATTIVDGVSVDQVRSGANHIELSVNRIVSRVVVTKASDMETKSTLDGTFSHTTYAVGQGALAAYIFPQIEGTEYKTWGYDYVPDGNYLATAAQYYCYEDLLDPFDVPVNLNTPQDPKANLANFDGKLLFENTHLYGTDASTTKYRKGNTAYVLISTIFTPNASSIKDGGALTGGTFYVGETDQEIYSSIEAATNATTTTGSYNQRVRTYKGGKMLYFVWLNPDDITRPMNSPVLRNNVYQVNISAIHKLGVNWNPLNPDINNPDPKPEGNEPESPIVPTDPLTLDDTYMTVDIEVANWTVHAYDVEL
jgi:hypothetical protein